MAINTNDILGLAVGLQATSLAVSNIPEDKDFKMSKSDFGLKRTIGKGVQNLAGIGLIKSTSKIIN